MAEPTEASTLKRHRVFLSYSRADRQRVLGILTLLEGLNHRVFMDQRSIPAGKRWKEELERLIALSQVWLDFGSVIRS